MACNGSRSTKISRRSPHPERKAHGAMCWALARYTGAKRERDCGRPRQCRLSGRMRPRCASRLSPPQRSVDFPQARRCKFKQTPVGIPEIDTASAGRPYGSAFDDELGAEALFPLGPAPLYRLRRPHVVGRYRRAAGWYRRACLPAQGKRRVGKAGARCDFRGESPHSLVGKQRG
jgi:hypothetical protein